MDPVCGKRYLAKSQTQTFLGIGIWFSDQLFRNLQNSRAAVNAVLGFSGWFGRVLGFRVAGPGARKQERAVSEGSLGAQKGW